KSQLWTPDVLLYNSADPQFDSSFQSNVLVYPDGMVNWIPPGIFRISCRIAVAWFPFDIQECFLKFGSWTFDGSKLHLDVDDNGFDLSSYIQNGEWELTATSVVQNIQHYQCCPEPYYDVVFTFIIRRRVLYYAFNLILPCILITMLTLIGFTLPPDAGEKMSLQITIMLSICIFQNYVAEMSPPTSEALPFLGSAFHSVTAILSKIVPTFVPTEGAAPRVFHKLRDCMTFRSVMLNWLPWLLMMHRPGYIAKGTKLVKEDSDEDEGGKHNVSVESIISTAITHVPPKLAVVDEVEQQPAEERRHLWRKGSRFLPERSIVPINEVTKEQVAQLVVLNEIHEHLSAITAEIREKERNKDVEDDWKFAAIVVDRLCLYIFSFFILLSTCALFSAVPRLEVLPSNS
ncbi:Neuronal acetylcholine receptor subunit alpha-7, partial [Trichostrongylus colubriformis]